MMRAILLWTAVLAAIAAAPADARTTIRKPPAGLSRAHASAPPAAFVKTAEPRIAGRPAPPSFGGAFNARLVPLGGPSTHPGTAAIGGGNIRRKH